MAANSIYTIRGDDVSYFISSNSETVPFEALNSVPLPARTRTHCPVPHGDFAGLGKDQVVAAFPDGEIDEQDALGRDGSHFFGLLQLRLDSDEYGLLIGLRGSHDKSLSRAIALGSSVYVCDNLVFRGSEVNVARKHTTYIWRDLRALAQGAIASARAAHDSDIVRLDALKELPVSIDRGYEHIGRALGQRVISPTAANATLREWRKPTHAEHDRRDAFGLYQAFTQGAKKGAPAESIGRHPAIDAFFGEARARHERAAVAS